MHIQVHGLPLEAERPDRVAATPVARAAGAADALELIDDPQEWSAFSRPWSGDAALIESSVVVAGMQCAACAQGLEAALRAVPGVLRAEVSAASGRASVVWSKDATRPSGWMRAIERSGYTVLPANDAAAHAIRQREGRQALWRWLVAGLCMMQVMMYAYPAYVAQPGDLSLEMERLLRWASWVLTLPVMLFSCAGFFQNAWRDMANRRVGMDLPVALGLLITFAVSTAGTFEPQGIFGREVFFDSLTMFVFFLLTGRWLELRLRSRTAGALESALNRLPEAVQRRAQDGSFALVAARRLRPGDTIRVLPGQAFAADGCIVQGETSVDQSLLTGESRPLALGQGDDVIAGSHNLVASVQVRVLRVGDDTRFAQIVALMRAAAAAKPRLALLADRVAKPFLTAVVVSALLAAAFWWPSDPQRALMVAVAVLIVTCPCALSLATPAAMLAAAGSLARAGVLLRNIQALEAAARVDTVVFDKTGTLTSEALRVDLLATREGISGERAWAMATALAQHSLHPVSRALALAGASAAGPQRWTAQRAVEEVGQGVRSWAAPGQADAPAVALRLGSAQFCGVAGQDPDTGHIFLSDAHGWLATFSLAQAVRPDASSTIAALRDSGMAVYMLSGDGAGASRAVAQAIGIDRFESGRTPAQKLQFLRELQAAGHRTAVVGDGLNDAPALAGADVSFAFGPAVPLARAQADFIVAGGQLIRVAQTLMLARRTMTVVRQNLGWALAYNLACVPLALVGWIPAWMAGLGMATSSLVVVGNALRLSRGLALPGPA